MFPYEGIVRVFTRLKQRTFALQITLGALGGQVTSLSGRPRMLMLLMREHHLQ